MLRWFGERDNAPAYDVAREIPTPVGDECVECTRKIEEGDSGYLIPHLWSERDFSTYHKYCFLRAVLGPSGIDLLERGDV